MTKHGSNVFHCKHTPPTPTVSDDSHIYHRKMKWRKPTDIFKLYHTQFRNKNIPSYALS